MQIIIRSLEVLLTSPYSTATGSLPCCSEQPRAARFMQAGIY